MTESDQPSSSAYEQWRQDPYLAQLLTAIGASDLPADLQGMFEKLVDDFQTGKNGGNIDPQRYGSLREHLKITPKNLKSLKNVLNNIANYLSSGKGQVARAQERLNRNSST